MTSKTKGETLLYLQREKFNVPKLILFNNFNYKKSKKKFIEKIKSKFKKKKIIVRSSSSSEDSTKFSNAGKFLSIGNIYAFQTKLVSDSIDKVISSYKSKKNNQIIVQEMVKNVKISGVCSTVDLHNYQPVTVINYYTGKDTEVVTSGKKNTFSLSITDKKYLSKSHKFYKLLNEIEKLKKIYKSNLLDIEFAINSKNRVFILQVRPIVIPKNKKIISKKFYLENIKRLKKKIIKLQEKNYDLFGNSNCFGIMPDWNPAEIIGTKPKNLALSLYKELVTDHVWAKNRERYGFKKISSHHLMTTFFGTPYIDVRVDFNSWIPDELDKQTSEKLVNIYLKKFSRNKLFHDKIEFKILFTCYTLNTEKRIKNELNNKLSLKETQNLRNSLININKIAFKTIHSDLEKIEKLRKKITLINKSKIHEINKIYFLIEECKNLGTEPFAGLARCGFIAIEILNSFEDERIISTHNKDNFLNSIENIATRINKDFKNLNKKNFCLKNGHIRPNTYDITSLNYREGYKLYFDKENIFKSKKKNFQFSTNQKKLINYFLKKSKITINAEQLINFIRSAIYNREYSKFIFTKCIDEIFNNLIRFGKKYNISREKLAYLDIQTILSFHDQLNPISIIKQINHEIDQNEYLFKKNSLIQLPETITSWRDLYVYEKNLNSGNFITQKKTHGKVYELKKIKNLNLIKDKILLIENADPGYDFIFSKKIKGLITKYGGQNSHMSIRCAELSIPAVIGVGDEKYNLIKTKNALTIDCINKQLY
jgi:glutamine kinase